MEVTPSMSQQLAHDLRTQLTVINGYASMLKDGGYGSLPVEAITAAEKIAVACEKVVTIIEQAEHKSAAKE